MKKVQTLCKKNCYCTSVVLAVVVQLLSLDSAPPASSSSSSEADFLLFTPGKNKGPRREKKEFHVVQTAPQKQN